MAGMYRDRRWLKATTALAVMTLVSGVAAGQGDAPAAEDDETVFNAVIVTGSRIKSPNLSSPNPITSLDAENIAYTGKTSVQEIVLELGALAGSEGDNEVSSGENALVLRNLGANRTLTLIDGQRYVGGFGGSSAVDTSVIPRAMIERVDVLTGGASAVYGADAVTGVVNFILKDDFEGVALDAQIGNSLKGDFEEAEISLTAGRNFGGGDGNVTFNYTYGNRPRTPATARARSSTNRFERINNINGDVPEFVLAPGTNEAFFTEGGARIDPFEIFSTGFNGDGTPFDNGVDIGSFAGTGQIGGDGIPNYILFTQGLRAKRDSHSITMKGHYDFSDALQPYFNISYSDIENSSLGQQALTVGSQVARDNAFLPDSVLQAAGATGGPPIFFNRWHLDGENRGLLDFSVDKESYRVIAGIKGDLTDWLSYETSANFGKVTRKERLENNLLYDRWLASIDAVDDGAGNIVCRSNLDASSFNGLATDFIQTGFDASLGAVTFTPGADSGCLPFNPLNPNSTIENAIAWDWITQPTTSNIENEQIVLNGYLTADSSLLFNLPGGPASFVLGAEYREETSDTDFDDFSGSTRSAAFTGGTDLAGEFDVIEGFAEVSLPIFKEAGPLLHGLTVDAAYRFSDYSTIGSTNTWKAGALWDLTPEFSLRGTISSAVRAPNIQELFQPRTNISISLGDDPCDIDNVGLGSETRAANCALELSAIGVDPATFDPLLGTFFGAIEGGNPNLQEETADTQTYGFLWTPSFVDGLVISADYFDIQLTDAVINPTDIAIFNACYDSPTLDNVFCPLLGRDETTGAANFVELQAVNVARLETSGVEFSVNYLLPYDRYGDFGVAMNGTYLEALDIQQSEVPTLVDEKGLFQTSSGGPAPEWVLNFDLSWAKASWDANYGFSYNSETLRNGFINAQRDIVDTILDDPYVNEYVNHDVQVGYTFNEDARVYLGMQNITNEQPDRQQSSFNITAGRQGYAGRFAYFGVNLTF